MQPIPTGCLRGSEDVIGIYASGLGAAIQNAEFRMQTIWDAAFLLDELEFAAGSLTRESLYWLRICSAIPVGPADQLRRLQGEADHLSGY